MRTSPHKLCRPPEGATDVERWTGKRWVKDDGKPGLAFSGHVNTVGLHLSILTYPAAWSTGECTSECWGVGPRSCPSRRALDRTCDRFGAANGRQVRALPVKKATPTRKGKK